MGTYHHKRGLHFINLLYWPWLNLVRQTCNNNKKVKKYINFYWGEMPRFLLWASPGAENMQRSGDEDMEPAQKRRESECLAERGTLCVEINTRSPDLQD